MGWWSDVLGMSKARAPAEPVQQPEMPRTHNLETWMLGGWADLLEFFGTTHPGTGGYGYGELAAVARVAPIAAMDQVRIEQAAKFCTSQVRDDQEGFRIRLRDRRREMKRSDEREAYSIEKILLTGTEPYSYGSFDMDMKALVRDSLRYDQANAEVLCTRGGKVCGMLPVDAASMRLAQPDADALRDGRWYPDERAYVQIGTELMKVESEYDRGDLLWGVRRPRTDRAVGRYGYPECDELGAVVASLVNAMTWNDINFHNGVHSNTIIALKSAMNTDMWNAFMRQLKAWTTGVKNAKRTIGIQIAKDDSMEVHKLGNTAIDMEMSNWINWLLKVCAAVKCIDPAELNFVFGNEGQTQALGGNANAMYRTVMSKERGLHPLLRTLERWIDTMVVRRINPDFAFEFVGLGALSPEERHKMKLDAVKNYMTVNEIRAQEDLKPLEHPMADVPLNELFRDAAVGNPMEEAPESYGADEQGLMPFPGAESESEGPGFAKSALRGVRWNDTDDWTTRLVRSGDRAMRSGAIGRVPYSRPVGGRTVHRMLPPISDEPGVRAWVVEVAA